MEVGNQELAEIRKGSVILYDILPRTLHINYLFDYSKILIKNKLYDPHIMNWQIENSLLLKQMGLNFNFIKKKMEERNKGYYKYDTLLSQISCKTLLYNTPIHLDRLEKHGQLAPLKEISKRLTEEDLKPDPDQHKSINDINFYNLNDSFIDDEDAYKGEEDDGFFKLNLAYGNYSEDEIIRNLNRNKARKKKNFSKIKRDNDRKNDLDPVNQLLSTGHPLSTESELKTKSKKRKFGESINMIALSTPANKHQTDNNNNNAPEEISEEEHLKMKFNALMKEYCELGFGIPLIDKEKEMFIKKIISAIKVLEQKWISEPSSYEKFLNIFSSQLNLNQKDFKIVFEYERFKSKIDGIYSNYAKLINQLVTFLVDANIKDIRSLSNIIKSNEECKEKADAICIKIYSYIKVYNDYFISVSLNAATEEEYYKTLDLFVPNGKERNEEYLSKLSSKMNELFDKYKVEYSMKELVDYFKLSLEHDIVAVPLEGGKVFVIEDFFFDALKSNKSPGEDSSSNALQINQQAIAQIQQGKKKKTIKGSAFSQMNIEQELKQDEKASREMKVPVIQVVIAKSPPPSLLVTSNPLGDQELLKDSWKEKRLIPNSITHYKKQQIPIISTNYYTCPFNEDHFMNLHISLKK